MQIISKHEKHTELAITISLAVAAIAEPFFVNPSFKNISLLFVGEFIFVKFNEFTKKKPDFFLNQKIKLCPLGEKEVYLPTDTIINILRHYCDSLKKNGKRIFIVAVCTGILAGTIFAFFTDIPDRYYVLRTSTQASTQDYFALDINNLPDDFEGKILNYKDAETPMQMFEGNISKMEYARGIVSSGLWCALFMAFCYSIILNRKNGSP